MDVFDVVFASSTRQAVLRELEDRPRQRRALLDDVEASKSAVYDALNELRDRDLVREGRTRRWETTRLGDIVADHVAQRDRAGSVLSTHADYWTTYDATALPEPFRLSLGALDGCERLTESDGGGSDDSTGLWDEVVDVVEHADRLAVVAPDWRDQSDADLHDRYVAVLERAGALERGTAPNRTDSDGDRLPERDVGADVRLLLADDGYRELGDQAAVRVGDPGFSLFVTDERVVLSLPREDGTYEAGGTLRAHTTRAREWGRRLFEHEWRDGVAVEESATFDE